MTRLGIITEGKEGNLLLGSSVVDVKSKIVVEVRMYSSMKKKPENCSQPINVCKFQ